MQSTPVTNTSRLEVYIDRDGERFRLQTVHDGTPSTLSRKELGERLSAMLHQFLYSIARVHLGPIGQKFMDHLLHFTVDRGFVTSTATDVLTKDRTFEITLHLGKTRWSPPPASEENGDESSQEKLLIYYDRSSGVWQILS